MSSFVAAGVALTAVGFLGKAIMRRSAAIKYYRGGFEPVMNRREAGLVLGLSPSSNQEKVKQAHKRIMLLNHPDRGGSPYLAAKINEAKDKLMN